MEVFTVHYIDFFSQCALIYLYSLLLTSESLNSLYSPIFLFAFLPPSRQFWCFYEPFYSEIMQFQGLSSPQFFFPCHWYLSTNNLLIHRPLGTRRCLRTWRNEHSKTVLATLAVIAIEPTCIFMFSLVRENFIMLSLVNNC